jgi:spermidine/putrescine transport system ATP-binding protein
MKNTIVEMRNIDKYFQDLQVLNQINLEVLSGEFLTLLGPSGCGKSTLLRLISGFETPSSGSILINGCDVKNVPPEERYVNIVFQNYALFPHMTVFDNVAFGLRCKHVPKDEIEERVSRVLRTVRMEHLWTRKPHQLSGGQQQRVAMARAIVNEPIVLLLDEPLSALDHALRKNMQVELKALQRQLGITFIFVTHDQEEALSMSDRVVVMQDGRIDQVGTQREVYEKPSSLYVAEFVGETNIFDSDVVSVDDKKMVVDIEGRYFTLNNTKNFQPGQKLHIVVRPEDLKSFSGNEVTEEEKGKMLIATVEQVIYKGSTVDLLLRTQGDKRLSTTEFFNEEDEDLDFRRGETVWVEWTSGWEVALLNEK